jgi:hypothetical protein
MSCLWNPRIHATNSTVMRAGRCRAGGLGFVDISSLKFGLTGSRRPPPRGAIRSKPSTWIPHLSFPLHGQPWPEIWNCRRTAH